MWMKPFVHVRLVRYLALTFQRIFCIRIKSFNAMTKQESNTIKGVAILLMIFLHLFMSEDVGKYCQPLFFIGDKPIVYYLSRGCRPVAFFLILSGYGLSYTYKYKTLNFKGQMNRLAKLYIHYWLILLIFVGIGCFVRPEKYPGTLEEAVLNIVSWKSSYNSETWFLLPYALLALSARYIFKVVDKLGNIISFGFFLFLNLAGGYIISRYVATHIITSNLFSMIIVYIGLSFPFIPNRSLEL